MEDKNVPSFGTTVTSGFINALHCSSVLYYKLLLDKGQTKSTDNQVIVKKYDGGDILCLSDSGDYIPEGCSEFSIGHLNSL